MTRDDKTLTAPGATGAWFVALTLAGCVGLAGASVMLYEFLAVRLLAPYFGNTLDVWAAEIAVCLAGLALGYFIGGWIADRVHSWRALGLALIIAGVTGFPMERLAHASGSRLLESDVLIGWHPLAASFVVSFIPLVALGAVLPQAIRLRVTELQRVGRAAGFVTGISTVGSIGGALSVPPLLAAFGVREVLHAVSAILVLAGVCVLVGARKGGRVALALLFISPAAYAQVQFETNSAYHRIVVEDQRGIRMLRFDNAIQSLMSVDNPWGGGFEYTEFFHVPMVFNPAIERSLFIGLGGGTGPKAFLRDYPSMKVDVIEIDPAVVRVARDWFHVPDDPRLRIQVGDGRALLNRGDTRYGAIIIDAYASGPQGAFLPYHMATYEFFQTVWKHLDNGGWMVYNAVGRHGAENGDIIAGLTVTLRSVFQSVYVYGVRNSINTVFVALKVDPEKLDENGLVDGKAWPEGPWLQHPVAPRDIRQLVSTLQTDGKIRMPNLDRRMQQISPAMRTQFRTRVYTDNYAPVDIRSRTR